LEKDVSDVKVVQIKRYWLRDADRLTLLVLNMRFEWTGIRHEAEFAFHWWVGALLSPCAVPI